MVYKVTRTCLTLFLAFLIAAPYPALAQSTQTKNEKQIKAQAEKERKEAEKERKEKEKAEKENNKKKNADVDNIGNRNINKGSLNFISLEKEIGLGRQLAAEIERQVKLVEDPTITEYVNRVGQNLVRNSDSKVPFTIKVVESDEINAFALPGGFFYVNSGLILAADDESELAGVIGAAM